MQKIYFPRNNFIFYQFWDGNTFSKFKLYIDFEHTHLENNLRNNIYLHFEILNPKIIWWYSQIPL